MKTIFVSIFAALLMMSCGEDKKPEGSAEIADERNDEKFDETEKDADFAVKAVDAGMQEVLLADLALQKTTNAEVKALATMAKADHEGANSELNALATQKNISLPQTMSDDLKKEYDDLINKTGSDFDKAYIDLMVKNHKNVVDLFEKESEKGNDPDMKSWAGAKLPSLRQHLEMAETTKDNLK